MSHFRLVGAHQPSFGSATIWIPLRSNTMKEGVHSIHFLPQWVVTLMLKKYGLFIQLTIFSLLRCALLLAVRLLSPGSLTRSSFPPLKYSRSLNWENWANQNKMNHIHFIRWQITVALPKFALFSFNYNLNDSFRFFLLSLKKLKNSNGIIKNEWAWADYEIRLIYLPGPFSFMGDFEYSPLFYFISGGEMAWRHDSHKKPRWRLSCLYVSE